MFKLCRRGEGLGERGFFLKPKIPDMVSNRKEKKLLFCSKGCREQNLEVGKRSDSPEGNSSQQGRRSCRSLTRGGGMAILAEGQRWSSQTRALENTLKQTTLDYNIMRGYSP